MAEVPESSSQALERYIAGQFSGLKLNVPVDDVEMMARFVEEDGLEREEKVEGVRGMLEGVVEEPLPETGVDEALDSIITEFERLKTADEEAAAAAAAAAAEAESSPEPMDHKAVLESMTEEELKAARKAALLRQYAYVEGGPEQSDLVFGATTREGGAPPKGAAAAEAEEKRKAEERRRQVEEALRLDGRKKKYKKAQQVDDPLMWSNLNKEKVQMASQMQRDMAKKDSQAKRERDRLALEKQRADAAKAKADKQKKAQKQERRG